MPVLQQQGNEIVQYLLWKNEPMAHCLHPHDAAGLAHITHPQKKIEYINSRAALQTLCESIHVGYAGIVKDEHGKPFLMNYPHFSIAISHIQTHAAAIITQQPQTATGIDLELISDKVMKIAPRVLHAQELQYAQHNVVQLTLIWSAKETLYKLQGRKGIHFSRQFFIHPFELRPQGTLWGEMHLPTQNYWVAINYEIYADFVLTWAALRY